jgi:hypothetical protein
MIYLRHTKTTIQDPDNEFAKTDEQTELKGSFFEDDQNAFQEDTRITKHWFEAYRLLEMGRFMFLVGSLLLCIIAVSILTYSEYDNEFVNDHSLSEYLLLYSIFF